MSELVNLTIDGTPVSVPLGGDTGVLALLATDDGPDSRPIPDRTVIFIGERAGGGRFGASAKTGLDGQAVLVPASWPAGSYTVRAYFGQDALALPDGTVTSFADTFYGSSASGPPVRKVPPWRSP